MEVSKNTYRGMNQDTSKTMHSPDFYYSARNIRIITEDGLSTGSVENEKGNLYLTTIPQTLFITAISTPTGASYPAGSITITDAQGNTYTNQNVFTETTTSTQAYLEDYAAFLATDPGFAAININTFFLDNRVIIYGRSLDIAGITVLTHQAVAALASKVIGEGKIRDDIYFIAADQDSYDPSNYGFIWKLVYTQDTNKDFSTSYFELIYTEVLGLSAEFPIGDEVEGRYESANIQKLYWVDGKHQLRFLNVAVDNQFLDPDTLNILPESTGQNIEIVRVENTGNITPGIVQYAYQLVTSQGGASSVSPLSAPVHIAESAQTESTTDYFGAPISGEGNKAINIRLTNIDTKYRYIKIFRIHYKDEFNSPIIDLVTEELISETATIDYTDVGGTLGAVSTSQFIGLIGNYFIPSTITTKENRLFTANNKEEEFDFPLDVRAYRFNASSLSYHINGTSGTRISPANWDTIPEQADTYNLTNESTAEGDYRFQSDGITIGGEGPNVSYEILSEGIIIDEDDNSYGPLQHDNQRTFGVTSADTNTFSNAYLSIANAGYKRGETYRFAAKAVSTKGLPSFAKWIADIRFPTTAEGFPTTTIGPNGEILAQNLYIKFNIDISSLPQAVRDSIAYIEIVRVDRDELNKTVLGQGLVNPIMTYSEGAGAEARITPYVLQIDEIQNQALSASAAGGYSFGQGPLEYSHLEFICPEQIFYKSINYNTTDFLRYQTVLRKSTRNAGTPDDFGTNSQKEPFNNIRLQATPLAAVFTLTTDNNRWVVTKGREAETRVLSALGVAQNPLLAAVSVNGTKGLVNNIDGIQIHNKVSFSEASLINGTNTGGKEGRGNSKMYLKASIPVDNFQWLNYTPDILEDNTGIIIADYKKVLSAQYGGYDFAARNSNTYITTHSRQYINGTNIEIDTRGGDTFISYFDYLRVSIIDDQNSVLRKWQEVVFVPLETTINLTLRHDRSWNYLANKSGLQAYPALQEALSLAKQQPTYNNSGDTNAGGSPFIVTANDLDVEQTDLYLFNATYSVKDKLIRSFPKPQLANISTVFDTQTRYSQTKNNNETQDNWTIFLLADRGNVDSKYGPITKLLTFNDEVIFVQNEGYGQWQVSPRVQTTANDGEAIELGKGSVLYDYKYMSTKFGTNQKFGIISSENSIYFLDSKTFKLISITNRQGALSDILGVSSTLKQIITPELQINSNPILNKGITTVYDRRFGDIIFTIKQSNAQNETVIYNELTQSFTSFMDYQPNIYSEHSRNLFSFKADKRSLYVHHYGPRGVFYDNPVAESSIDILVNPNPDTNKRFDNIEYYSQVFEDITNNELFEETITSIRFYNDYQDTGNIALTNRQNIRRRMRKWRMHIARDIQDNKSRMRNPYLFISLSFDNNNNKKFVLHHLLTYYNTNLY